MKNNKQLITVWEQADATFESGYGHVTYRQFCELEIKRMASHGKTVHIINRKDGCIALAPGAKRVRRKPQSSVPTSVAAPAGRGTRSAPASTGKGEPAVRSRRAT